MIMHRHALLHVEKTRLLMRPLTDDKECNLVKSTDYEEFVRTTISLAEIDETITYHDADNDAKQETSSESLTKEELSYGLLHTCCRLFEIRNCQCFLNGTEHNILLLSTLRALELASLRLCSEHNFSISKKEHLALRCLEKNLVNLYKKNEPFQHIKHFNSVLQRVYMAMLMECRLDEASNCEQGVPLVLISFLMDNDLANQPDEEVSDRFRSLCLFTLRNFNRPRVSSIDDNDYEIVFKEFEELFSEIVERFIKLIKGCPSETTSILKLLKYYGNYEDVDGGRTLICIWKNTANYLYDNKTREIDTAMLLVLLNCVRHHNGNKVSFRSLIYEMFVYLEKCCHDMDATYTDTVLESWGELVFFFNANQLNSLQLLLKEAFVGDQTMSSDTVKLFVNTLSTNYKHEIDSCQFLVFLKPEDENFTEAIREILNNTDNFTVAALLFVADIVHTGKKLIKYELMEETSADVFCGEVECLIKTAFHRIGEITTSCSELDIKWIIKAFNDESKYDVTHTRQFREFLDTFERESFSKLSTVLALMSKIEDIETEGNCKVRFGERIIGMVDISMFNYIRYCNSRSYQGVLETLEEVKSYFVQYSTDRLSYFTSILQAIKCENKKKKKLVSMMNSTFI